MAGKCLPADLTWLELTTPVAGHDTGEIAEPTLLIVRAALDEVADLGWMQTALTRERLVSPRLGENVGSPAQRTGSANRQQSTQTWKIANIAMLRRGSHTRACDRYVRGGMRYINILSLSLFIFLISLGFTSDFGSEIFLRYFKYLAAILGRRFYLRNIQRCAECLTPPASGTACGAAFWSARSRTGSVSGSSACRPYVRVVTRLPGEPSVQLPFGHGLIAPLALSSPAARGASLCTSRRSRCGPRGRRP